MAYLNGKRIGIRLYGGEGGGSNKLQELAAGTITEVTEADLEGATGIRPNFFSMCYQLKTVVIPASVAYIGEQAFQACTGLKTVTLKGSPSLLSQAFGVCMTLESLIIESATPPHLGYTDVFQGTPSSFKIYVPKGSADTYKAATNWSALADKIYELEV